MPEYVKIQPQYDPARLLEHERCSGHGRVPLCTLCWANMFAIDKRFAHEHFQEEWNDNTGLCGNQACPNGHRVFSAAELGGTRGCCGKRTKMCPVCYCYGTAANIAKEHCLLVRSLAECEARYCPRRGTDHSALPAGSPAKLENYVHRFPRRLPLCVSCWTNVIDDNTLRSRYFFLDVRLGKDTACATGPSICPGGASGVGLTNSKLAYPIPRPAAICRTTGLCPLCYSQTDAITRGHVCYQDVELTIWGCESSECAKRREAYDRARDAGQSPL